MRHRAGHQRASQRKVGLVLGLAALVGGAGSSGLWSATAEECTALDGVARCAPSENPPVNSRAQSPYGPIGAGAAPGDNVETMPFTREMHDETSEANAAASGPNSYALVSALYSSNGTATADGPRSSAATVDNTNGTSSATAIGEEAVSASAAAQSSTANARSEGDRSRSASAATLDSTADAQAQGTGATSGAAAYSGSQATARPVGTDSTARASAYEHDRAFAMAGPFSTADVAGATPSSGAYARCRGFAIGADRNSGAVCAGPISNRPGEQGRPHEGEKGDKKPGKDDDCRN